MTVMLVVDGSTEQQRSAPTITDCRTRVAPLPEAQNQYSVASANRSWILVDVVRRRWKGRRSSSSPSAVDQTRSPLYSPDSSPRPLGVADIPRKPHYAEHGATSTRSGAPIRQLTTRTFLIRVLPQFDPQMALQGPIIPTRAFFPPVRQNPDNLIELRTRRSTTWSWISLSSLRVAQFPSIHSRHRIS